MSGLFVRKHAEAVRAQGIDVRVIFSESWTDTWRQWRTLRCEGWMPDVVQLNVIQKQGLLALWLKKRYGIPYVIVEHWSGYLPENGQFMRMSAFRQKLYRRIAAQASAVHPVSLPLQRAMQSCGIKAQEWGTIDNVVDDFFFESPGASFRRNGGRPCPLRLERLTNDQSPIRTLLHVSCFDERAKNVKGLLRAAKMLSEMRQDWRLVLVGTGVDFADVRAYADSMEIPEGLLRWTGELTPREVADEMRQADAFVLSSRYETYGVVLAEAAAAGLPILSTPVGIAEETADLIVPQEIAQHKPGRFAEFIETILWNSPQKSAGKDFGNRFLKETIGLRLKEIYEQALCPK